MDPEVIHQRMIVLEETPDRNRTVIEAAAEILEVPHDEDLEKVMRNELWRTTVLCRTHYTPSVAMLPNERAMLAAMLQGITLAVAILQDKEP